MNINFTADMDERPTLTELMRFGEHHVNLIEEIGDRYHNFGAKLLKDDKNGNKIKAIEREHCERADINKAVLIRWIGGEGRKPTNWATLTNVLDECRLNLLADQIRFTKIKPGTS